MTEFTHPAIKHHPAEPIFNRKIICIAWINHDERTAQIAKHLGADAYFVQWGPRKWYLAPLRYIVQGALTWSILRKARPDIVFIQLPPIFLALVVTFHKLLYGTDYLIDSHSGSFVTRIGRLTQGWHRFFSRHALLTLVHNTDILNKTANWGAPVLRLGYLPGQYPAGNPYPLSSDLNVVFTCTFASDEPVAQVIEAARQLPDSHIYITGNYRRAPHHLEGAPQNVTFTGYLAFEDFIGLLRGADVIMDLTTRKDTLLLGGFEAVSLEKPLITSDSRTLREYFSTGTVYVDNSPQGIADGIRQARAELQTLQHDVKVLKDSLMADWEKNYQELTQVIMQTG